MFDSRNVMSIDGDKLRKELEKRNLSHSKAAQELGVASSTVSGWVSRERVPGYGLKLLETMYKIHPEDIAPESEKGEEPVNDIVEVAAVSETELLAKLDQIDQHILEMTAFLKEAWGVKG